jgi:hypothetical protein
LQKQFFTVLIALSLPLVAVFSPSACMGDSLLGLRPAQAANSAPKTPVDYNAGSSLTGENSESGDTKSMTTGESAAAQSEGGDTTGGAAVSTPNGTGVTDSSMESVWSEQAAPPAGKSAKSKKKNHERSRSESSKSSKSKTARKKGSQTPSADSAGSDPSTAAAAATTSAGGDNTASESYTNANLGAAAGQPTNSASVLDRPVTLGTVTTGAGKQNQSEEESAPEAKATTPSRLSPSASAAASGNNGAVNHPPDNVFTSKLNVGEHAAPLCATRSFFQSELIRSVSWPGVGPFKGDSDPNDLVDPQENKLTLQTSGDKVTSAELILLHQPGNPQGFINLEMVMDSMLEALGARDKKINDFNTFLEKNKEVLAKNKATEEKPLKTANGPYLISIAGSGKNNESSYLIQVKSKQSAEEASRTQSAEASESREETGTTRTGSVSVATSIPQNNGQTGGTSGATRTQKKPPEQTATTGESTKPPVKQTKPPVKEVPKATDEESTAASSGDTLKQEFADTIRSWQSIKQEADKTRDVTLLAKVLTGKALAKQTVAIGWLVKEKKYYEITPKGVNVDKYQEISKAPQRYAVYAHVKELSRLLDDGTNKLNKETDDQYNVNYTLEKTGDHWSIYDSQLIQQPGQAAAGQNKSAPKAKH